MSDTVAGANNPAFDKPRAPIAEADLCVWFYSPSSSLWNRIATRAGRRLDDPCEGEDIAQETALRVLQAIRNGKRIEPRGFPQYCMATANRLVSERVEEKFLLCNLNAAVPNGSPLTDEDAGDTPAEDRLSDELIGRRFPNPETRLFVGELLAMLSERQRTVMVLTVFGFEDSEIAEKLELTDNNVRQIRHRIRSKFSKEPPTPEALDSQSV